MRVDETDHPSFGPCSAMLTSHDHHNDTALHNSLLVVWDQDQHLHLLMYRTQLQLQPHKAVSSTYSSSSESSRCQSI